ncbi:hypothetical protein V5799_019192 [Amblyomma americanum]|uniref:Uncharacterized protein n=1 Tax=Amblyomma americanum TaxID=6943 RepID=A0AAQ4EXJ8_AMBAM
MEREKNPPGISDPSVREVQDALVPSGGLRRRGTPKLRFIPEGDDVRLPAAIDKYRLRWLRPEDWMDSVTLKSQEETSQNSGKMRPRRS